MCLGLGVGDELDTDQDTVMGLEGLVNWASERETEGGWGRKMYRRLKLSELDKKLLWLLLEVRGRRV